MAQHYRDLVAWQIATELRRIIIRITEAPHPKGDAKFVTDIRGSSRSIASNLAEGHGRFDPLENARFVEIAKAALDETENHLMDGRSSGYFHSADFEDAHLLVRLLTAMLMRLLRYLRSPEAQQKATRIRKRLNEGSSRT